jgi:hypothetical protein
MIFNPIPFGTQAPLRHSKTYHSDSLAHLWIGVSFFSVCPHMVHTSGCFKMVSIDGASYSRAYGALNHFETTQ